jgi:hypothetical protein
MWTALRYLTIMSCGFCVGGVEISFLLPNKRKHFTQNWSFHIVRGCAAEILAFSVILVVFMLSLKLKQDGPNKKEVYRAIKASNKM